MEAYVFPGQASQFVGMGKDMYQQSEIARSMFERANAILGFRITDIMFNGTEEDLKRTDVTQPAVFLHSVIKAAMAGDAFQPQAVAGHSLGEFTALVAAKAIDFEDGLRLVQKRAQAMQYACDNNPSTMAAIIGMKEEEVESICEDTNGTVVAANYNCPGQIVISGVVDAVNEVVETSKKNGARMAVVLPVNGAFHSPLMACAQDDLNEAIKNTNIKAPICPIYQNVSAKPTTDPKLISENLSKQLTAPVLWTQTMHNMITDGLTSVVEVGGNGKTLAGFFKRVDRKIPSKAL